MQLSIPFDVEVKAVAHSNVSPALIKERLAFLATFPPNPQHDEEILFLQHNLELIQESDHGHLSD